MSAMLSIRGSNRFGQLGIDGKPNSSLPTLVEFDLPSPMAASMDAAAVEQWTIIADVYAGYGHRSYTLRYVPHVAPVVCI